jgi:hypothetical protein
VLQVKSTAKVVGVIWLISIASLAAFSQTSLPSDQVSLGAPRVIRFKGLWKDSSGQTLNGKVNVKFSIYSEPTGGSPLWQETQSVQFSDGQYSIFLGLGSETGIPAELFRSGEACWLGVRALLDGEQEQPRVFLASVPFALKASDADTLGGLPPQAFLRTEAQTLVQSESRAVPYFSLGPQSVPSQSGPALPTQNENADAIAKFSASSSITSSQIRERNGTVTLKNLENILFVDRYGSVASCLSALPSSGGTCWVPPHYRETFTDTINVGKGYVGGPVSSDTLFLDNDVTLTCNISTDHPCFRLASGSGIVGRTVGYGAPSQAGGSVIYIPSSARISSVITPAYPNGTQQSYFLKDFTITSVPGATISGAGIDVSTVADGTIIDGVVVIEFPGILMRLRATPGVPGPCCGVSIRNVWLDGGATAGIKNAQPLVIQGAPSGAVEGVTFEGGSFTNSSTNYPIITINGLSSSNVHDLVFHNVHLERDVANSAPWIGIRDAANIIFDGLETTDGGSGPSDLFHISESKHGLTHSISLRNIHNAAAAYAIRDTVSDPVVTTATRYLPDYKLLGANSYTNCTPGSVEGHCSFANGDFNPAITIKGTSPKSSNSANLQFQDNDGTPRSWYLRKGGSSFVFIAPSGGSYSIEDSPSHHDLRATEVATCLMVSGTCTVTWNSAFRSTPVCGATWDGSGTLTGIVRATPSATGCAVTSSVATDTAEMQVIGIANPN